MENPILFDCCDTCSHTSNARNNFETLCRAEGLCMDTKPTDCCPCFSGAQYEIPTQISHLWVMRRGNREMKFSMFGLEVFFLSTLFLCLQHRSPSKTGP